MAKKTQKPSERQVQQKAALKALSRKGLYRAKKPRAAPTRYGKSLLQRFADVLEGRASVVTAPKSKRSKGHKAAREYSETLRTVRNKIVVPTHANETARYSPKARKVLVTRRVGRDRYIREPFKEKITSLEQLKRLMGKKDYVSIPLYRGRKGTEWRNLSYENFEEFWGEYGPGGTGKHYQNLGANIEAFRILGPSARAIEPDDDFDDDYI